MSRCRFHRIEPGKLACERCGLQIKTNRPPSQAHASCSAWPLWWEWGEWAAVFLSAAGITSGRWIWLKRQLGLVPACGCSERKTSLDTWGARTAAWLVKLRG